MYSRQTAPKEFYDTIMQQWPTLKYDVKLYSLILYLMLPTWRNSENGNIVLERKLIAKLVNEEDKFLKNDFKSSYWLDKVKELLPRFEYSSYATDRAREVTVIEWPKAIQEGLDNIHMNYHNKVSDVFLLTGNAVNKRNITKVRQEEYDYAQAIEKDRQKKLTKMAQSGIKEADTILTMLNSLSRADIPRPAGQEPGHWRHTDYARAAGKCNQTGDGGPNDQRRKRRARDRREIEPVRRCLPS